jgi:hypothetical protein
MRSRFTPPSHSVHGRKSANSTKESSTARRRGSRPCCRVGRRRASSPSRCVLKLLKERREQAKQRSLTLQMQ